MGTRTTSTKRLAALKQGYPLGKKGKVSKSPPETYGPESERQLYGTTGMKLRARAKAKRA